MYLWNGISPFVDKTAIWGFADYFVRVLRDFVQENNRKKFPLKIRYNRYHKYAEFVMVEQDNTISQPLVFNKDQLYLLKYCRTIGKAADKKILLNELIVMNVSCAKHQEYFQIMFLEQGQIFRSKFENAVKTVTKMVESLNFNMVWELSWS